MIVPQVLLSFRIHMAKLSRVGDMLWLADVLLDPRLETDIREKAMFDTIFLQLGLLGI